MELDDGLDIQLAEGQLWGKERNEEQLLAWVHEWVMVPFVVGEESGAQSLTYELCDVH